jgi:multidrug efflux pump subunit AcrA (membrane-fusion protein)
LSYDAKNSNTIIREGMLADVVIIQEEKESVLRIPTSAITYEDGNPTVQVVDSLSDEQQEQFDRLGIVRLS